MFASTGEWDQGEESATTRWNRETCMADLQARLASTGGRGYSRDGLEFKALVNERQAAATGAGVGAGTGATPARAAGLCEYTQPKPLLHDEEVSKAGEPQDDDDGIYSVPEDVSEGDDQDAKAEAPPKNGASETEDVKQHALVSTVSEEPTTTQVS